KPFQASIEKAQVSFATHSVRLSYQGGSLTTFDLPSATSSLFGLPVSGDFGFTVAGLQTPLFGVDMGNVSFTFGQISGVPGLRGFSGQTASFPLVGVLSFGGEF